MSQSTCKRFKRQALPFRAAMVLVWLVLIVCSQANVDSQDSSEHDGLAASEFLRRAAAVLPMEARYDYHRTFDAGSIHQPGRDARTVPGDMEVSIDATWSILSAQQCGSLTSFGVQDMVEYFRRSMQLDGVG